MQQQKQVIDATETAILALDVHGKIVWKTQKASDLLNQYLPELEGFEAGLKAWFSDLEHEKTPKINQLFLFGTISAITAFIAYAVGK